MKAQKIAEGAYVKLAGYPKSRSTTGVILEVGCPFVTVALLDGQRVNVRPGELVVI